MKYLLLTTSPFQTVNACIFASQSSTSSLTWIIVENFYSESELAQIKFLSSLFNIKLIKLNNKTWFGDYRYISSHNINDFDYLIICPNNHWSAFHAAFLPISKLAIVDDGAHSLSNFTIGQGEPLWKKILYRSSYSFFQHLISRKQTVDRLSLFPVNTTFNLIKTDYTKLSSWLEKIDLDYSFQNNTALFIGTPISEVGVITLETEIKTIELAAKYFQETNKQFIYIAHSKDSVQKCRQLDDLGINVLRLGGPIELYLSKILNLSDISICSISSTVLFTAGNMGFDLDKIISFRINESYFLKHYPEKYQKIFDNFQSLQFQVIDS